MISFTFIIYLGTKWVSSDKTGNRHTLKNNDSQKQQKHFGAGIFRSASQSRLVGKLVLALLSIRFAWNFYQMISGTIINLRDFKEIILDLKVLFVFFSILLRFARPKGASDSNIWDLLSLAGVSLYQMVSFMFNLDNSYDQHSVINIQIQLLQGIIFLSSLLNDYRPCLDYCRAWKPLLNICRAPGSWCLSDI